MVYIFYTNFSWFHCIIVKEESERDLSNFLILPFLLWRMLHNQIWISLSRYRNAKGSNLLVDKSLEFEQVDREQIGQCTICINISTNKYRDTIYFFTIFSIIIDIIYCDWYCIIKVVSMMDPCKTNVFLITTYPLINLYI